MVKLDGRRRACRICQRGRGWPTAHSRSAGKPRRCRAAISRREGHSLPHRHQPWRGHRRRRRRWRRCQSPPRACRRWRCRRHSGIKRYSDQATGSQIEDPRAPLRKALASGARLLRISGRAGPQREFVCVLLPSSRAVIPSSADGIHYHTDLSKVSALWPWRVILHSLLKGKYVDAQGDRAATQGEPPAQSALAGVMADVPKLRPGLTTFRAAGRNDVAALKLKEKTSSNAAIPSLQLMAPGYHMT